MFNFNFFIECFVESIKGIPTTLIIAAVSIFVSIFLGYGLAISRIKRIPALSQFAALYVSFVRGTPIIAQLFLIYFALPMGLMSFLKSLGISVNLYNMNPIIFAFVVFSLNATSLMTEILRSALGSVDKGQREAAISIGMGSFHTYTRIIIPQALITALPSLCNLTTNILKNTSLAMQVSVAEITGMGKTYASIKYSYLESFVAILIIYLVLNTIIEKGFRALEIHLKKKKGFAL